MGHMWRGQASLHGLLAGREVSLRVAMNRVGELADACGRLLTDTAYAKGEYHFLDVRKMVQKCVEERGFTCYHYVLMLIYCQVFARIT